MKIVVLILVILFIPTASFGRAETPLCYADIHNAYQAADNGQGFTLENPTECRSHKLDYDHAFRLGQKNYYDSDPSFIATFKFLETDLAKDGKIFGSKVLITQFDGKPSDVEAVFRHPASDFFMFPGEHTARIYVDIGDNFHLSDLSHGEIVDAAERKRREDMQNWQGRSNVEVESQLCFMKIKQADVTEIFTGTFELEDNEICGKYIVKYNKIYDQK